MPWSPRDAIRARVVFPDAFRKFFLTATTAERARRRHAEFLARGEAIDLDRVERDLIERDERDEAQGHRAR